VIQFVGACCGDVQQREINHVIVATASTSPTRAQPNSLSLRFFRKDCIARYGLIKLEKTRGAQVQNSTFCFLLQQQGSTVDLNGGDSLEILWDIKQANPIF
jgi:DUF2075 family protein